MFRTRQTKAIDALATEMIRAVQWYPIPVTVAHVARQIQEELARVGVKVSLLKVCKRVEKAHRRMCK